VRTQRVNQSLRIGIARHRDRQIGVSRKSRFGTRGNGKAADQCKRNMGVGEISVDLT
jgi:hypothetical protein